MKKILILITLLASFTCHSALAPKGQKSFKMTAKSWIVSSQGQILQGRNTTEVRAIGSITKLMTAMVVLDANKSITSKKDQDLLQRALVHSDNRASTELCQSYPGGYGQCIFMMNFKARELGLVNTKFTDATGLSVFNSSNTEDLVKIVEAASTYPEIVQASQTKKGNTNPTIGKYDYSVSKTGYIHIAGGCIVAKVNDRIIVILGSKNVRTRITELEHLIKI